MFSQRSKFESFDKLKLIFLFKLQLLNTINSLGNQHKFELFDKFKLISDIDQKNIDLFNLTRSKDINLCIALSSTKDEKNLYFYL